jgi:hypothetical protein
MLTFTNTPATKDKLVATLELDAKNGYFRSIEYLQDGKISSVGLALKKTSVDLSDYEQFEIQFNIPFRLAKLNDEIFRQISYHIPQFAESWPVRFAKSIPIGVDLSLVWAKFMFFLLIDPKFGCIQYARSKDIPIILTVTQLLGQFIQGITPPRKEWKSAYKAAEEVNKDVDVYETRKRDAASTSVDIAFGIAYKVNHPNDDYFVAIESCAEAVYLSNNKCLSSTRMAYQRMADKLIELIQENSPFAQNQNLFA